MHVPIAADADAERFSAGNGWSGNRKGGQSSDNKSELSHGVSSSEENKLRKRGNAPGCLLNRCSGWLTIGPFSF
jgi:hypothetical protein